MRAILAVITRCANYASALFLAAMMLITVSDVVMRAVFNLPITGAYDLVQLFLVGTVFLSIPDVFLRDKNIVIDFVDHVFGARAIGALKLIANIIAITFLAVLLWRMISPALEFGPVSRGVARPFDSDGRALGADDRGHRHHPAGRPLRADRERARVFARTSQAMNPQAVGVAGFIVMVTIIFLRIPVAIALGLVGTVGYAVLNGWSQAFLVLGRVPFNFASAYDLSVVPLFVLMGSIARQSGMARELFQSINVMFSGRRGTLATATIGACAALGSVSGSSVAMVATISHVAVPEMRRAKYDERLALGSVVAGATLGILFPPSVMLIFYGLTAVQSIPKLFAAGFIPGLVLATLQIGVVKTAIWLNPSWAPISPPAPWRERLAASIGMWKLLCIFMLSIGGIYAGWFSPTEAAAIGAFSTIVIATLSGGLTFRKLADAALESAAPRRCCSSSYSAL